MRTTLLLTWLFLLTVPLSGQAGFYLPEGKRHIDIPFEFKNNFILLTLHFNGTLPLRFIFDTGAEHTVLTKREISDLMQVRYDREFHIRGSDLQDDLIAFLARNIRLDIPQKATAPSESILVLKEDYFRFEEYAGINAQGILSAGAFSKFLIKINYDKKVLSLYLRDGFKLDAADYVAIPVELFRNKLYVNTTIQVLPDSVANVKLLIDTGAGLPLLLFSNTHPLVTAPISALPTQIGMGMGGYLEGFTGRVFSLDLGPYKQNSVVTYFQTLDTSYHHSYLNQRNGIIGNSLLRHFDVVLDYEKGMMYLRPSKKYSEDFRYDRSGLQLIASGPSLNTFLVQHVLPNSPAAHAGIERGDVLLKVGFTPCAFQTLEGVQKTFQGEPGKKVKVVVRRGKQKIRTSLVLRDLI